MLARAREMVGGEEERGWREGIGGGWYGEKGNGDGESGNGSEGREGTLVGIRGMAARGGNHGGG